MSPSFSAASLFEDCKSLRCEDMTRRRSSCCVIGSVGDDEDKDNERDERRERSVGDVCVPTSWWNNSVGSLT